MISLFHRKNEISIDLSGVENPAGIEIYYNGKMYAESQLPDDWQLLSNKNKIVCLRYKRNQHQKMAKVDIDSFCYD